MTPLVLEGFYISMSERFNFEGMDGKIHVISLGDSVTFRTTILDIDVSGKTYKQAYCLMSCLKQISHRVKVA